MSKTAVIIGAGPAGLTAALELLRRSDILPIVLESSEDIGGISRTIRYKGNRMDIGGHRFFSKSDRVMQWWMEIMPPETASATAIRYQNQERRIPPQAAAATIMPDADSVMLIRPRKSRIYFLRQFFSYPITLTSDTLRKLGLTRTIRVATSYLWSRFHRIEPETSLEDFFINRFGRELYQTFFKSYTEKVWGVPCQQISADWGAQRIKGLSLSRAIAHFMGKTFKIKSSLDSYNTNSQTIAQKGTETSLIEQFLYPKYGPGQLWELVADRIRELGGQVLTGWRVDRLHVRENSVESLEAVHSTGERRIFKGDYFFSTMPVRELINSLDIAIPGTVREVSEGLEYRDFITVGLLARRLAVTEPDGSMLKDTWIYIQEPDVQLGRLQIFNNWSPCMVADPATIWLGLEYFCYDTDALWRMSDTELKTFAADELVQIGILHRDDFLDAHVVRVAKTYPAYFGTYDRFDTIREFTDRFDNLFLVGRNGMHKYNNQDHSMLTAMTAVDNIVAGIKDKKNLWEINTEQEYHEEDK